MNRDPNRYRFTDKVPTDDEKNAVAIRYLQWLAKGMTANLDIISNKNNFVGKIGRASYSGPRISVSVHVDIGGHSCVLEVFARRDWIVRRSYIQARIKTVSPTVVLSGSVGLPDSGNLSALVENMERAVKVNYAAYLRNR